MASQIQCTQPESKHKDHLNHAILRLEVCTMRFRKPFSAITDSTESSYRPFDVIKSKPIVLSPHYLCFNLDATSDHVNAVYPPP